MALTLGLAVVSGVLLTSAGRPMFYLLYVQLAGAGFVILGVMIWLARPELRLGDLMIWLAIAVYVGDLYLSTNEVVRTVGLFLPGASSALYVHVLLAYPTGRVNGRIRRILLAYGYAIFLVIPALKVPFLDSSTWLTRPGPNALLLHRSDAIVDRLTAIGTIGVEIDGVVLLVFMAVAYARATPLLGRVLFPAYVPSAMVALAAVTASATRGWGPFHGATDVLSYLPQILSVLCPVGFLFGVFSTRAPLTDVTGLVGFDGPHEELETALRATLRDPALLLLRPDEAAVPRPDRAHRPIVRDGQVTAVLDHHCDLLDEPQLLAATASVIGVTLHNRTLKELAESQRHEVRESRLRIVEAAHEARRGLERDLHDGTQQRLIAAIVRQRMLENDLRRQGVSTGELVATIDEIERALDELREIGRGIHPALVAQRGLSAALRDMVARTPLPIRFVPAPLPALGGISETALYFAVSECVTNAVRHSEATDIELRVEVEDGWVQVTVSDNGRGGALTDGAGIRGVADRIAAIGGEMTVESAAGAGTVVTLRVGVND